MSSSAFKMQRIPELRFSATLGGEPEVELAPVKLLSPGVAPFSSGKTTTVGGADVGETNILL